MQYWELLYREIVAVGFEEHKDRCETCRLMLQWLADIPLCFEVRNYRDFLQVWRVILVIIQLDAQNVVL